MRSSTNNPQSISRGALALLVLTIVACGGSSSDEDSAGSAPPGASEQTCEATYNTTTCYSPSGERYPPSFDWSTPGPNDYTSGKKCGNGNVAYEWTGIKNGTDCQQLCSDYVFQVPESEGGSENQDGMYPQGSKVCCAYQDNASDKKCRISKADADGWNDDEDYKAIKGTADYPVSYCDVQSSWAFTGSDVASTTFEVTIDIGTSLTTSFQESVEAKMSLSGESKFFDGDDYTSISGSLEVDATASLGEAIQIDADGSFTENCTASCSGRDLYRSKFSAQPWYGPTVLQADDGSCERHSVETCSFQCISDAAAECGPICIDSTCSGDDCQCCNTVWAAVDALDPTGKAGPAGIEEYLSVENGGQCDFQEGDIPNCPEQE